MQTHSTAGIPAGILAIDLGPIMIKAMMDGMTREQVALAERELRRFYTLHLLYPNEPISPSALIDDIWHHHQLDTIYYGRDCHEMFGHFLHHFPYVGLRGKEDAAELERMFDRTKTLYEQAFGEPMPQAFEGSICGSGCATEEEPPPPRDVKCCNGNLDASAYCAACCHIYTDPAGYVTPRGPPARPRFEDYLASLN